MKLNRALFIDDENISNGGGVQPYMTLLRKWGYEVEWKSSPNEGIEAAKAYKFALVFVDYRFDNSPLTGAEVGRILRRKYPLLALIIMSGYLKQSEAIEDYIDVAFDAAFEKEPEGVEASRMAEKLKSVIAKAKDRAAKRVPEYDEAQSEEILKRLDVVERACRQIIGTGRGNIIEKIATAANMIWITGNELTPSDLHDLKILMAQRHELRSATELRWIKKGKQEGKKWTTRSRWTQIFQVWQKSSRGQLDGKLKREAVIARDLIMTHPGRWRTAFERYAPITKLVDEFGLESYAIGS